jgi:hypothetical protein
MEFKEEGPNLLEKCKSCVVDFLNQFGVMLVFILIIGSQELSDLSHLMGIMMKARYEPSTVFMT